jgi:uncharacterized OsmC-like protein
LSFSETDAWDHRFFYGTDGIDRREGREGTTMPEHVVATAVVANDGKPYGVIIESGRVEIHLSYSVPDRARRWIDRAITLHGPLDDAQRAKMAEVAEKTPVTSAVRSGAEIRATVDMPAVDR